MRRLLAASAAAADSGEFEVAYHALMAALHAAEAVGRTTASITPIGEVEKAAKRQSARLEKLKPSHQLSRESARTRGHESVYDTLLVHARSTRLRITGELRREKTAFRSPSTAMSGVRYD